MITVLVIDDHDVFRTGLASMLASEPGLDVVAHTSRGRMGVQLAEQLRPAVILMDMRMPELSGPEATRQILARDPEARVLAITISSDDRDVGIALQAGACGFVAKDTQVDDLIAAIRAAAGGAAWLSPRAAQVVLGNLRQDDAGPPVEPASVDRLTARELEVLRLIAAAKENSEIAAELNISPRTAKNHVSSILAKLGLPNRVQAAVYAVRHGVS